VVAANLQNADAIFYISFVANGILRGRLSNLAGFVLGGPRHEEERNGRAFGDDCGMGKGCKENGVSCLIDHKH